MVKDETKFKIKLVVLVLLGLALMIVMAAPKANDLKISSGINCGIQAPDGIWEQQHMTRTRDNCGPTNSIQYVGETGPKFKSIGLNYGLGFRYSKGISLTEFEAVNDDCYGRRQYSGGAINNSYGSPIPECDLRWNFTGIEATTRAYTLSIGPTWYIDKYSTLSISAGISLNRTVTQITPDNTKGVCALSTCDMKYHWLSRKSTYAELSAQHRGLFVTGYFAPNEGSGGESPQAGNFGVFAGYRVQM